MIRGAKDTEQKNKRSFFLFCYVLYIHIYTLHTFMSSCQKEIIREIIIKNSNERVKGQASICKYVDWTYSENEFDMMLSGMTTMVHKASSQYTAASALTVNTTQTVNQTNDSVDRASFRLFCIIVPPSDFFHANVLWPRRTSLQLGPTRGPRQTSKRQQDSLIII